MTDKYKNINIITQQAVAAMRAGESYKITPALEALSQEEIMTLAIDGLSYWVNENLRAAA